MLSLETIGYRIITKPEDTPDKIDFERMAKSWRGLEKVIDVLTHASQNQPRNQ